MAKEAIIDTKDAARITRDIYDNQGKILQNISPVEYDSTKDTLVADSNGIATTDAYKDSEAGVRYMYDSQTGKLVGTEVGSYDITYDEEGNVTDVNVAGNTLATYDSGDGNKVISSTTYANGAIITREKEETTKEHIKVNGVIKYSYSYDKNGTLLSVHSLDGNQTTSFSTDDNGATTVKVTDDATTKVINSYTVSKDSSVFTDTIGSTTNGLKTDSANKNDTFSYNGQEVYKKDYSENKAIFKKMDNTNILTVKQQTM